MIKVAIADDHKVVVNGLSNMLEHFPHIEVIDRYENGKALLEGLKKRTPEVLLLDIHMPDIQGDELAEIITEQHPTVYILAVTGFDTSFYVKTMLEKGALGYLLKNTDQNILLEAIEAVSKGQQYIDPSLRQQVLQDVFKNRKQDSFALTGREKEILKLIAEEYTNQEIAEKLYLALRTVVNHRMALMQKLGVKNMAGLVRIALQMGLVK